MMILLTIFGFIGRLSFAFFSELMGRRNAGGLLGFGAGVLTIVAGYNYDSMIMGVSAFWLILAVTYFFADGGFAIVGPYAAEIWPSHLRTTGMGSAYGFGGIGKIIGPVGLAMIVGSGTYLKPDVPLPQIPLAFTCPYVGWSTALASSSTANTINRTLTRPSGSPWAPPQWPCMELLPSTSAAAAPVPLPPQQGQRQQGQGQGRPQKLRRSNLQRLSRPSRRLRLAVVPWTASRSCIATSSGKNSARRRKKRRRAGGRKNWR